MIDMRWSMAIVAVFGTGAGLGSAVGCHGTPEPRDPVGAAAQRAPDGKAQVVARQEARRASATALVMPFGIGRDGTKLVADFLARADAAHADAVFDLAIVIQSRRDDQFVECRAEVVPESVTAPQWQPPADRAVPLEPLITRTLTEWVYQCGPVTSTQIRSRTDYDQKCGLVTRPLPRSTTVYSEGGMSASSTMSGGSPSARSTSASFVPFTDFYTEYNSVYECNKVPVVRVGPEQVTETRCAPDLQTRTVTRHEFQLEQLYIPGHFEGFTRQRLRELAPVCYTIDARAAKTAQPRNRIEGRLLTRAH
jgi:hypothetical protein